MITDIPTSEDFRQFGVAFLNLAWTAVIDLYLQTENSYSTLVESPELTDDFWAAAQRPLSNAAALVQQGIEFLIKSRIVEVSPYLLLDGSPRDWPRACHSSDVPFAEFRAIDAQDLVKVHDTVRFPRLSPTFIQRVSELRRIRNSIMHTVDRGLRIQPARVLVYILETSHHLIGPEQWVKLRREHLDDSPETIAFSGDYNEGRLVQECMLLPHLLSRSEVREYLGMAKVQRWYICPRCTSAAKDMEELFPATAQLRPNEPVATSIYCFVCAEATVITRMMCTEKSCRGNVLYEEERCLTCYAYQTRTSTPEDAKDGV